MCIILSLVTRRMRQGIERSQINILTLPPKGLRVHGLVTCGKPQKEGGKSGKAQFGN